MQREILLIYNKGDKRKRYQFIERPLRELILEKNLNVEVNIFTQAPGVKGTFQTLRKCFEKDRNRKQSIIYCGADMSGLTWVAGCRLSRKKILLRLGGHQVDTLKLLMDNAKKRNKLKLWLRCLFNLYATRLALKWASGIISVSGILSRQFVEEGIVNPHRPFFVVHQPVKAPPELCNVHNFDQSKKSLSLLTAANFSLVEKIEPIKVLINSFLGETWLKSQPIIASVAYNILGGGQHLPELQEYVSNLRDNLRARNITVNVVGHVDDLSSWYMAADVFLYGSTHDLVPNVLLEAQAYGLPIVVNITDEFKEFLVGGVNAVFYKTGDQEGVAKALSELLENPGYMKKISAENFASVRRNFGHPAIREQLTPVVSFCCNE